MSTDLLFLAPFFFFAAFLYSSVGHGGASSYLAILVLAGFPRLEIASIALALNVLVTLLGTANYYRAGHFDGRLLLPFILTSVPAAYLGGSLHVSEKTFSLILGAALFMAGLRFLLLGRPITPRRILPRNLLFGVGLPVGFGLGFLAGLIGIGGGIFFSPLLLLLGWADAKKTAAVSAAFIFLNSMSGLVAQLLKRPPDWTLLGALAATVLVGGGIGSYIGAFRLLPATLQRLLGLVLLMASVKLLI